MRKQLFILGLLAVASVSYGKEVMAGAMMVEDVVMVSDTMPVEDEKFFDNFYFKVGMDVNQEYTNHSFIPEQSVEFKAGETSGTGWFAALEATRNMTEEFELGIGLGYQAHSDGELTIKWERGSMKALYGYDSIPLYFVGKYKFASMGEFVPYVKAVAGYSFNSNSNNNTMSMDLGLSQHRNLEVDNGLYYGAGVGLQKENIALEVMYEVNKADIRQLERILGGIDFSEADYSRITLGITFNF